MKWEHRQARKVVGRQALVARALLWVVPCLIFAQVPTHAAPGQGRPYIGFVYPAGGKQATTFPLRLGGQGLDEVERIHISGPGVRVRILDYQRSLNAQEVALLREQLQELKRAAKQSTSEDAAAMMLSDLPGMTGAEHDDAPAKEASGAAHAALAARIEKRLANAVNRPASVSLANVLEAEVTISAEAAPGLRELRVETRRGLSNPLVFFVGQLPETTREPLGTTPLQVLGKESSALRKRPAATEIEELTPPCTVNGQVASGEIHRYRFSARTGQDLVVMVKARELVPFIADAVPGWFQPVIALYDGQGKQVAYADDFRFKPDPVLHYRVPADGEYRLHIWDALFRGREDFVYRATLGEVPFVTSLFPLGARAGSSFKSTVKFEGYNLQEAKLSLPDPTSPPGLYEVSVRRPAFFGNPLRFAVDSYPEFMEREPNNDPASAQLVQLPAIINGRMDRAADSDCFRFTGRSNEWVVAEVYARRLDSPMDPVIRLLDAQGRVVAMNDDYPEAVVGTGTHFADPFVMTRLPADGEYLVRVEDVAAAAGPEYAYRLRLSPPRPDFALRVTPSSVSLRPGRSATVDVHLLRKEGFEGPVRLALRDPPLGFSSPGLTMSATQTVAQFTLRAAATATRDPVSLWISGSATVNGQTLTRLAVPCEDRMQAFLWRHMAPAQELKAVVIDPVRPAPGAAFAANRTATPQAGASTNAPSSGSATRSAPQPASGRLRQLHALRAEGLITESFFKTKVAEFQAAASKPEDSPDRPGQGKRAR